MNAFILNGNGRDAACHISTKRWIRLIFIYALIFVSTVAARAQSGTTGDLSWSISGGMLTISGTGAMPDYNNSPEQPWYSYQSSITAVVLENGVTSIGNYAFYYCSALVSVAIPGSVISIGDLAFDGCTSLTSIMIPNSVTSIGGTAFSNCFSLMSVTIPNSVTSIGSGAFSLCKSLTSVTIPNSVTSIGSNAFYACDSLMSFEVDANNTDYSSENGVLFDKTKTILLQYPPAKTDINYTISSLVTSIVPWAFFGCRNLASFQVDANNAEYSSENGVLFDKAKTILIQYPPAKTDINYTIPSSVTSIVNDAFYKCTGLMSVTIPNSVTSIGGEAFAECSNLTSIVIPNSVTSIGYSAFIRCSSLTTIAIPNSVTSIEMQTFTSCTGLTSVIIPNSVTSIGNIAFAGCSSLTEITNYASTPQTIDSYTFDGVDISSCVLRIPLGSSPAYRAADAWKDFDNIVEFVAVPHYTAVTQFYPDNMTVTAAVMLNGAESQSDHIEIGAFCGSECRGSVVLQNYPENTIHPYLGFMTVHGNAGDNIVFKVFNHDTSKEYDAFNNAPVSFAADAINGDPTSPYMITVSDVVTQTIPLSAGWSWISVNIEGDNPSLLDQFKSSVGDAGNLLKGRTEFIQTPGWIGTLQEINNSEMYMVNTSAESSLSFTGLPINPAYTSIPLLTGWNWIGYTPQTSLSLDEALAGLTPQDGDQIKSRASYSSYVSGQGWVGSLSAMNPGEGYKYYSANSQTLVYPSTTSQLRSSSSENENALPLKWTADANRFQNTMTLTSVVLSGNEELQNDQIEIGAFCGDECRGSVQLKDFPQVAVHPYLGFLVVYGDSNESIRLRVYNHTTGQEYDASNVLSFASDDIYGSPSDPYRVVTSPTGICNPPSGSVTVYLDSQNKTLNIRYPWSSIDQLEIVDLTGHIVWQTTGFTSESVNVSSLAQGIYILKLVKDGQLFVYKFIKN